MDAHMRRFICVTIAITIVLAFSSYSVYGALKSDSTVQKQQNIINLGENNWKYMMTGEWMVVFFAPWCPACKNLVSTWERFSLRTNDYNVNVAQIDVTSAPSLSGRFFVTALPTIFHVKDGEFRQYRGQRDFESLLLFVKEKQWKKLEPVSAWKHPDTLHMSILSQFFKLSHTLKEFNVRLQEEYGLPMWATYALFAVATIFIGASLGLVMVCAVDLFYPNKKGRQSFNEQRAQHDEVEDIARDEIEDEAEELDKETTEDDEEAEEKSDEEKEEDAEAPQLVAAKEVKTEEDKVETAGDGNADKPEKIVAQEAEESKSATDVRKRKPRKAD